MWVLTEKVSGKIADLTPPDGFVFPASQTVVLDTISVREIRKDGSFGPDLLNSDDTMEQQG